MDYNRSIDKELKISGVYIACIIFVILYHIMPFVSRFVSTYLTTYFALLIVIILWLLFLSWNNGRWVNKVPALLAISAIQTIHSIIIGGESIVYAVYGFLLNLCPIAIGILCYSLPYTTRRKITLITVLSIIVTVITTIIGSYRLGTGAIRYATSVGSADDAYYIVTDWQNIGSFSFVYMVLVIYPIIIYCCKKRKVFFPIQIAIAIGVTYFFFRSEFATALLVSLACSLLWVIPFRTKLQTKLLIVLAFSAVAFFSKNYIADLSYQFASTTSSTTLMERFLYIGDTLSGISHDVFAVGRRRQVIEQSFNTILRNPIVGTWLSSYRNIGGHSYVLDFIAQYGIIGWILIISSYKQIFSLYRENNTDDLKNQYYLFSIIIAVVLSIINTGDHWFELILVIPLILSFS